MRWTLLVLVFSPSLLSASIFNSKERIRLHRHRDYDPTKRSSHVEGTRADGLISWGNGNLELARSEKVSLGSPLTVVLYSYVEGEISSCSFSNPGGQVWTVSGSDVTDSEGAAVAGVSGLEENNGTTCGLIVESATMFDHIGDWSCRISTDLGVDLIGYISTAEEEVSTNLRLPEDVEALSYELSLTPNMENTDVHLVQFDGDVTITFNVYSPKPCIRIQADEISILADYLSSDSEVLTPVSYGFDFQRTFFEVCTAEGFEPETEYKLRLIYYVDSLRSGYYAYGFYQKACARGSDILCWFTQGEATNARNTFPCLDEPGFKAKHKVQVVRSEGWSTLSNMPLVSTEELEPGLFMDSFQESVAMSSYLFALAITNYKPVESSVEGKGPHTIWAPAADVAVGRSDYAADIGARVVNFYGTTFSVDYALPKMDMCVQPGMGGAMENWGLVLYDPVCLLLDPELVTEDLDEDRWIVSSVIAHELAHQWFGNLVTLNWWSQMWLNEGFATYVSYLGAEEVDPANYPWGRMIIDETFYVMNYDSQTDRHWAISDPVLNRPDIERKFGVYTYSKGGSLIRMMEEILSKEVLIQGLSNYLQSFAYSSTTEDDLFFYLEEAGLAANTWPHTYPIEEAVHKTFGEVMKTWTNQAGYPLVTVNQDCDDMGCYYNTSQTWFVTGGGTNGENREFDIPVTTTVVTPTINSGWAVGLPDFWLTTSTASRFMETRLEAPDRALLILNTQATGYYRVNYDDAAWRLIGDYLKQIPENIHPFNRAKLVCDLQVLAANGDVSQDILNYVLDGYQDTDPVVQWALDYCSNGFKDFKPKPRRI